MSTNHTDNGVLKTLWKLIIEISRTSPKKAVASLLLTVALSITEGISLLLLMPLLSLVGVEEPSSMPRVAGWFEALFSFLGLKPSLAGALVLFVGLAGVRTLVTRWQSTVNIAMREDMTAKIRLRLYRAIAGAEWKFIVTRRPSEFTHVLSNEVGRVALATQQVIDLFVAASIALVYLALAFHFSLVMALVVLSCAAALAWAIRGNLKKARSMGGVASSARKKLHAVLSEHVSSLKVAKSYGAIERHDQIFLAQSEQSRDISMNVVGVQTDLQQRLEFGSTLLLALIVFLSYEFLQLGSAQLLVLLFIFARLMPRMVTIYRQVQGVAAVLPVLNEVSELEQECLASAETVAPQEVPITLERRIRLENVSFTYPRRNSPALDKIDLEIEAGQTTAIVGTSGAGKSTLADLLIALLSPNDGNIFIDDKGLTGDLLASWRKNIGYVPQETFLFHDTVRANLSWANPQASDQELCEALRLAASYDFVMGLPQGLETVLGERGVLVSGGERQRLSLARAILRRPKMLLLDEATSSLDSENELRIQQAIEILHEQMTIVVITHRLSTIRQADRIHVIEQGRLVESGSWESLINRSEGRFRELCKAQGIAVPGLTRPSDKVAASYIQN